MDVEIAAKLASHAMWLDTKGKQGERADLSGCDLRNENLSGISLEEATLHRTDLRGANLRGCNMNYASLGLWCGSKFEADERICKQLVAHVKDIMRRSGEGSPELLRLMDEYAAGWHCESEFKGL